MSFLKDTLVTPLLTCNFYSLYVTTYVVTPLKVRLYQPLVLFLPKFYIQAIFVIIGDISTIMFLCYLKSIVYNPTSELVLSIRIDAINQVVISS